MLHNYTDYIHDIVDFPKPGITFKDIQPLLANPIVFNNAIKGELTIVISEIGKKTRKFDEEKIVNKVKKYLKKYSLKDTVNLILETEKINKKKIYDLCLKIKNEKNF